MDRLVVIRNQLASNPNTPLQTIQLRKININIYDGNIAVLFLNSPKDLNALSTDMRKDIIKAFKDLEKDPKVKVIIIQSKVDKIFCAGADIKEFPNLTYESQIKDDIFQDFCTTINKFKKPIIAAVHGGAFGGGFELALMCDIIICTDEARLGLPELRLGQIPGFGGSQRLYRMLGKFVSSKMVLTSKSITGIMAKNYGLAVSVVNKEDLFNEALKMARRIAEKSLNVLILAKDVLKKSDELPLEHGLQYERSIFNSLFSLKSTKEGVGAFLEKKTPNFKDL